MMHKQEELQKLIRTWILEMSTVAGSGHPTSSLSSVEIMSMLLFGRDKNDDAFFFFNKENIEYNGNDRLIFSKGHASPLYYALWCAAGSISEEDLMTFRQFNSVLEGHPTRRFPFTEVPTGSLGQGLSVGVGEALALRAQNSIARVFVLLGDSEMAEGQVWEAMQIASYYALDNLVAIVDVNRLGQRGETMIGHDVDVYKRRAEAFGWHAIVVDGHNNGEITDAYSEVLGNDKKTRKPVMLIAHTEKGHGVSFLENKEGWHGKVLSDGKLDEALSEIGEVDRNIRGNFSIRKDELPETKIEESSENVQLPEYVAGELIAPRNAYGDTISVLAKANSAVVVLDAETSNSTKSESVKKETPDQFYEMFIAEQNMVSVAVGMSRRGLRPFVSTFAAFLVRGADQIRMAQYAHVDVTFVGSHCGVSIGVDGASQMGLGDMALFSGIVRDGVILYPSDAVSTSKCTELAYAICGMSYLRVTREALPVLYSLEEKFVVGGSKVVQMSDNDAVMICVAGITVHAAIKASAILSKEGITVRVIDCYSIKPLDKDTIREAGEEVGKMVIVEDHHEIGGLGSAIRCALDGINIEIKHLFVDKEPRSGQPQELLAYEEIDFAGIVRAVREMVQ